MGNTRASYSLPMTLSIHEIMDAKNHHPMGSLEYRKIYHQLTPQSEVLTTDMPPEFLQKVIKNIVSGPTADLVSTALQHGFEEGQTIDTDHGVMVLYKKSLSKGLVTLATHSSGTFDIEYEPSSSSLTRIIISTRMNEETIWPEGRNPRDAVGGMFREIMDLIIKTRFARTGFK